MLLTVCCPKGTYGPQCETCPGGTERPCSGNGECEVSFLYDYSAQAEMLL